jgi:predicted nucleic acid-binding protein
MTALVFVDTNVFVYWRDANSPSKQARATEWLDILWREQRGRTSTQVLSEYYAVIRRKATTLVSIDDAWRDVQDLMAWQPHPIDVDLIERAHFLEHRYRLNWWDGLIVAAAQAQGCATLLSEDMQNGAEHGGVTVRNPFLLSVAEDHATYSARPRIVSRHRGRGRPRRTPVRNVDAPS